MTIQDTINSIDRLNAAFADWYLKAKEHYPDLDELTAVAQRIDPDVGWLDVAAYLDGGAPTHFSEAIDSFGLPIHKRWVKGRLVNVNSH